MDVARATLPKCVGRGAVLTRWDICFGKSGDAVLARFVQIFSGREVTALELRQVWLRRGWGGGAWYTHIR